MQSYANHSTCVYSSPCRQDGSNEFSMIQSEIKGDVHEGMHRNGQGEHATCQVAGAHKPALGKAGAGLNLDGITA